MVDTLDRSRTPLLTLITQESLDRDYQVVAARRDPAEPEGRGSRTAVVVVVAAFAMLVTVAAVQTNRNAEVKSASRASLIERIEVRRAEVGGLQEEIALLRETNAAAQEELGRLGGRLGAARARRAELGVLTGFAAATGPGVRITLDNPPGADPNDQIRDADLALLADGLWAAGADAIAINGRRVTGAGGIRNSGLAIEVNGRGIAPPYTVLAIGDRGTLAADFVQSQGGQSFVALANQFGFTYDIDNVSELRLPAAPPALQNLQFARDATGVSKDQQGGATP